jgi:hypothetical protein
MGLSIVVFLGVSLRIIDGHGNQWTILELREETGLQFAEALFEEVGDFDYQKHKRLHLYRLSASESLECLGHLI